VQVEQLIEIAKLIEANPALQTELVSSILSSCTNEAIDLHAILSKVTPKGEDHRPERFWKALVAVSKEKRILAHLAKLEQGKSSLALCIETVDRQEFESGEAVYLSDTLKVLHCIQSISRSLQYRLSLTVYLKKSLLSGIAFAK